MSSDLVFRLKKRAEIRRQIPGRKSVEEGKPDRIADLLDEAATKHAMLLDMFKAAAWKAGYTREETNVLLEELENYEGNIRCGDYNQEQGI